MSRADSIKILYQELKTGILSLTDIQEQVDMNKKQQKEKSQKSKKRMERRSEKKKETTQKKKERERNR